jgi:F-type H+-transporting ATPase subunit b
MNINLTLLGQAIAFGLFIWFTARFVWPPLIKAIETRQRQIADGLAAAERGKQDLASAESRAAQLENEARAKAQQILAQGEKRAAAIVDEAKVNAKVEGDRIVAGAKAEIDQEVQRVKADLRQQVAVLAVAGAEKILRREVDEKVHADILSGLSQQL